MSQARLIIVPLSFSEACAAIARLHRHHQPPQGWKFGWGVETPDGRLVGAASAGRPVARALWDGFTLEVTRVATDGTPNACSALYAAAWRTASAAGYQRLVTYTQHGESGTSLRAAGWRLTAVLRPRRGWDTPSRHRQDHGTDRVGRYLWEQSREAAPPLPLADLRNAIRNEIGCRADGCTQPLTRSPRGRPALYCSPACRVRAYRARSAKTN
ncbi:XF1762 family protein [Streptomyces sp. NPDC088097]|uniref:XF1762 family protein n=1 Tax=Streptomyces sp. NPDC088097 TaxID=3365823 RepID=UPI0038268F10